MKTFKEIIKWIVSLFSREKVESAVEPVVKEWTPVGDYRPSHPYTQRKKHNNRKRTRGRQFQVISYYVGSHIRDDRTWCKGRPTSKVIYHNN